MPKICYVPKNFHGKSLRLIEQANEVLESLSQHVADITLRQLYYQLVSQNIIPNTPTSYDNLGALINDARLAGLIDWESLVDRSRYPRKNAHWEDPKDFMSSVMPQFAIDRWEGQTYRPEVWVEKDALVGIVGQVCKPLDVPYFSCRGYTSQTEMWNASQRLIAHRDNGYTPLILHFGDHDPSGIDMTRDVEDRLKLFCEDDIEVRRIALNKDQVKKHKLPPNPAKMTDCRAKDYVAIHGPHSWELDALDPRVLAGLIKNAIEDVRDDEPFDERTMLETEGREKLVKLTEDLE